METSDKWKLGNTTLNLREETKDGLCVEREMTSYRQNVALSSGPGETGCRARTVAAQWPDFVIAFGRLAMRASHPFGTSHFSFALLLLRKTPQSQSGGQLRPI